MPKHEQKYPLEIEDPDELANLPPDQVFTGQQLAMRPGQTLAQKAQELGVTTQTLRLYHLELRCVNYDPEYRIRRAGHRNWLKNKWRGRDWTEALRQQIAKGKHRHIGSSLAMRRFGHRSTLSSSGSFGIPACPTLLSTGATSFGGSLTRPLPTTRSAKPRTSRTAYRKSRQPIVLQTRPLRTWRTRLGSDAE